MASVDDKISKTFAKESEVEFAGVEYTTSGFKTDPEKAYFWDPIRYSGDNHGGIYYVFDMQKQTATLLFREWNNKMVNWADEGRVYKDLAVTRTIDQFPRQVRGLFDAVNAQHPGRPENQRFVSVEISDDRARLGSIYLQEATGFAAGNQKGGTFLPVENVGDRVMVADPLTGMACIADTKGTVGHIPGFCIRKEDVPSGLVRAYGQAAANPGEAVVLQRVVPDSVDFLNFNEIPLSVPHLSGGR